MSATNTFCALLAHVFARKGLTATTISDIAAAANMSHGLAYHYFASKEEIFRTR